MKWLLRNFGCYGKILVAMAISMWPTDEYGCCYNLTSVPILNMAEIGNLVIVGKEITGCYGEILAAMDTKVIVKRSLDIDILIPPSVTFPNMLKMENL